MDDAATDAAAMASRIRRRAGSVTGRACCTNPTRPLSAAAPYNTVLSSNQPETAVPSRRRQLVTTRCGLVARSQVAKWARSTVPSSELAFNKMASSTTSQMRTPKASK
jgi:hypothetical protein